jgi:acid stress-induced BolA-like protein IbaG/YrbA
MASTLDDIRSALETSISDAQSVDVTGDGRHFNIKVVAPCFEGLSTLERHRKVLNALKELMAGDDAPVHAIDSIRATPS